MRISDWSSDVCSSDLRSKMRHLVCVCLHEGRSGRGARDIVTTGGMSRQPVEPIDEAQHIRHEYVGVGEGPGLPFASCQHRVQMLEPGLEELVQTLPCRRIAGVAGELDGEVDGAARAEQIADFSVDLA